MKRRKKEERRDNRASRSREPLALIKINKARERSVRLPPPRQFYLARGLLLHLRFLFLRARVGPRSDYRKFVDHFRSIEAFFFRKIGRELSTFFPRDSLR